jgi:nucleoside-diphosphate-sugar epimerase
VYNLGSGRSTRLADTLAELIALCRVHAEAQVDPSLLRPSDIPRQEADNRKFVELTGWQPRIPWHTTLRDTFDYWREKVREEKLCAS